MRASNAITMVRSPKDGTVFTDPSVRYRPARIRGRRYRVDPRLPRPEIRTAAPTPPAAGRPQS